MQNRYLAWKYKQEVIITDSKTTEGYQASLSLNYKPGMRGDFRDIRFSDKLGNPLYYFIDPPQFAISARIWVRLPANDTLIYMYWGNGGAADASNGAAVFEFWDDFNTLNLKTQWTVVGGAASVANSILTLYSDTKNCMIRSTITYGAEYALEFRMRRHGGNKTVCGYWSTSLNMACWVGTYALHTINYNDHMYTKDGVSATGVDDGVDRAGSTYYIYGIVNAANAPIFTVNYEYRGTVLLTPPSGDLPIGFYSEIAKTLEIDWVRVRKYETAKPGMTLGKRWTTNPKTYPWFDMLDGVSTTAMSTDVVCKDTTSCLATTEMSAITLLRQRKYYRPENRTAYNGWKYKGDIKVVSHGVDQASNILPDLSGNGNNGTMSNVGLTADNLGNPYGAMSFNGIDSLVSGAHSDSLTMGLSDFSIHAVVYPENVTGAGSTAKMIIDKKYEDTNNAGYYLRIENGKSTFKIANGTTSYSRASNTTLSINTWYVLTVVANRTGNLLFYTNGTLDRIVDMSATSGWNLNSSDRFGIGRTVSTALDQFDGLIREIIIYKRALSQAEVTALYNNQSVSSTGLVAEWQPSALVPVRIDLKPLPGMTLDCRDIRFSDPHNKKLPYYVEYNAAAGFYYCFVSNPTQCKTIHIYYGNAVSKSESNTSVISTVDVNDNIKFYNPDVKGAYSRWKYRGNIHINTESGPATVQIPFYPGMAADGRDIRFSDVNGKKLSYYLDPDGIPSRVFIFDVERQTRGSMIHFYYGHAVSKSESDISVRTGSGEGQNQYFQVLSSGKLNKWKYKGDLEIDSLTLGDIKVPVNIPLLPGMATDGRDIRFSDTKGNELSYYIDSLVQTNYAIATYHNTPGPDSAYWIGADSTGYWMFSGGHATRFTQTGTIKRVRFYATNVSALDTFKITIWSKNESTGLYTLVSITANLKTSIADGYNDIDLSNENVSVTEGMSFGIILVSTGAHTAFIASSSSGSWIFGETKYARSPTYTDYDWSAQSESGTGRTIDIDFLMESPDIIFIGDSILSGFPLATAYTDQPVFGGSANSTSIPYKLRTLSGLTYQNLGINGNGYPDLNTRFAKDITGKHPKYVVIEGGLNNLMYGTATTGAIISGTELQITSAQAAGIVPVVVLVTPAYGTNYLNASQSMQADAVNNAIIAYHALNPDFIIVDAREDLGSYNAQTGWALDSQYNSNSDNVHLNEAGNAVVAQKIHDSILGFHPSIIFSCWVLWPANTSKINFYYGKHNVISKSNVSAFSGLLTGYPDFLPAIEIDGIYRKWKYKGDISITNETIDGEQIQIRIPFYPGMAVDGRDIRFSDTKGNELSYYIESLISNVFICWVKCTVGISTINFYYGNGLVLSRSNPSNVFDFWDDFLTLDSGVWSTFSGTPTASNSTAVLGGTATTATRSIRTFGNDTICEMKMYHPVGNKSLCGYWGVGNLREVWEGGYGSFNNDYMHTYNGSTQTNTSSGVDRGGSTYYIYGIAYLSTGPLYYVDYGYVGQITTNLPTGNLPIALYSNANFGNVVVDWVRVRKYSMNTTQVLRHSPQLNNPMPYINDRKTKTVRHYLAKTTLDYYAVPYSNTVLNHAPQLNTTSYYREPSPNIISRHAPQSQSTHYYFDYISIGAYTEMHGGEPTFVERVELSQFSLISVDISRSVNDAYIQLSGEFANDMVPYEGAIVKYYTNDINEVKTLVFIGKVVANSPTIGYMGTTVNMIATDNSRNLIVQHINWNHQVIYLSDEIPTWSQWITEIISTQNTGVVAEKIIDVRTQNKQFVFDPKTTRFEAIKKIAGYCNYVLNIKPKMYGAVMLPAFYAAPPEQIDSNVNGFDLPQPVEFNWPDSTIIDKPTITNDIEEKYNTVVVYGVITSSGETTVAVAYTPSVEYGDIKPREFTINDNSIEEKSSTAEIEAIKWLLYFSSPRATVTVRLTKRLDFELYQRIRFGSGFAKALQDLTFTEQLKHVVAYDPRDESNTKHIVDVSGVPRPQWLRVNEIKYHKENIDEYIEIKAITDFIYSVEDATVNYPYSTYISPGYIKPVLDDSTSMTQSIVSNAIDKQLSPEICTVISISTDESTAVVQTQSGKLITVRLK